MIIGVDAGCLGIKDERLAVGVYGLAKDLLLELGKIDKKNNYFLYSFYPIHKKIMDSFGKRMTNIVVKPARGWLKLWLPLQLIYDKPDIFLALGQSFPAMTPFSPRMKTIGFIYDLAFEKFPEMYPGSQNRLSRNSKNLVKHSDSIIAISESTKKDLITLYKVSVNKIKVLYPGISDNMFIKTKKYSFKTPYFLFVGSLKRSKNISGVLQAFSYCCEKTKSDCLLFVVGGDKWLDPAIENLFDMFNLSIKKRIRFLGHVKNDTLINLYKNAVAFVSPSYYEGFGFPFLEAMAMGCPVVGSKRGSIPEIVGNAGILVDPDNYVAIATAMEKFLKDKKAVNIYVKRGLERSKKFSSKKFAKGIYELLH